MKSISIIKIYILITLTLALISCSQTPSKSTIPVASSYNTSSINSQRSKIVQASYQTIGAPYRYGGTTYSGFDCSGLTRHAYKSAGISIPRTAAQQRDASRTVHSYSNLLPGDMIFFKTGRKTNHVGIFVGNGEFIHASTGQKRVVKVSLDTPYWRRAFVKFGTYIR